MFTCVSKRKYLQLFLAVILLASSNSGVGHYLNRCDTKSPKNIHFDVYQVKSCSTSTRWWVGPWQHCSITCGKGRGLRRRTVICVRSLSDDEQMALHDADCPVADRPIEEDACEPLAPCPGEASWETGVWSKVT